MLLSLVVLFHCVIALFSCNALLFTVELIKKERSGMSILMNSGATFKDNVFAN